LKIETVFPVKITYTMNGIRTLTYIYRILTETPPGKTNGSLDSTPVIFPKAWLRGRAITVDFRCFIGSIAFRFSYFPMMICKL
jgi:hypothetical protein